MKRKLLFFILMLALSISFVKAEENPFLFDWNTSRSSELVATFNAPYQNGYASVDTDVFNEKYLLRTYDIDGKVLKERHVTDHVYSLETRDDDLYTVECDSIIATRGLQPVCNIVLYDSSLDVVAKQQISSNFRFKDLLLQGSLLIVNDEYVIPIPTSANNKTAYSRDLKTSDSYFSSPEEFSKVLFPNIEDYPGLMSSFIEEIEASLGSPMMNFSDDYLAISIQKIDDSCPVSIDPEDPNYDPDEIENCLKTKVILYSNDGEKVFEKELPEPSAVTGIAYTNGYVVVTILSEDNSSIVVLDMEGNIVQQIDSTVGYAFVKATPAGFIVSETDINHILLLYGAISGIPSNFIMVTPNPSYGPTPNDGEVLPAQSYRKTKHEVYYLSRNVETVVKSGKGTVSVQSKARQGLPVTFVVEPEEGYVLSSVKVTDANGEVVEFHDYTFTMPSADVEIEVEFVLAAKNPETKDIAIIALICLAGIIGVAVLHQKNKFAWLK